MSRPHAEDEMQRLLRPLYRWYFRHSYQPQPLVEPGPYPAAVRLDTVTWRATETPICVTTCLQMIAGHFGQHRPRRYYDFLMGFTYGASEMPGFGYMPSGQDPETGYLDAAPYLGLQRHYFITDDPALLLRAIRFHLAQGRPVRLPLDMSVLYGTDEATPHSIVVIGYDASGFEYYEPVCRPPVPCRPAEHQAGDAGCFVTGDLLLAAVNSQARLFGYPWSYALSIFEAGPKTEDWQPLWQRNGRNLVGGRQMGMRWGAPATEHLAAQLENSGQTIDPVRLRLACEIGAMTRADNAVFLRETTGSNAPGAKVADLFEQANRSFQAGLTLLEQEPINQHQATAVAARLREVAAAEREAGQQFLTIAQGVAP